MSTAAEASVYSPSTKGQLVVVTGPSGVGKGRVLARLQELLPQQLAYSVSSTTRQPRPGEVHGEHYYFESRADFERGIEAGDFLEWVEYNGNLYGTSAQRVNALLAQGKWVLLEIEVQGAKQVKQLAPEARFVFIAPPSLEELERRLRERGTETEAVLQQRLAVGQAELAEQHWFDQVLVNEVVEGCAQALADWLGLSATA